MRYQSWDVLLFPGQSRIPIQEFNTACHILCQQAGQLAASKWAPPEDPFVTKYESMTKTPILTCFIASLPVGSSFRVSIHSWARPSASSILKSRKAQDEPIAFQARLYIDGALQSTRVFREGNVWPEVIDGRYHEPDAELAFPVFHPEILQQPRWEPGEKVGRIQLILTEGVLREASDLQASACKITFDGLRDVVAFSFQHAPQDVLEYSGIAWPNARLFETKTQSTRQPGPISTRTVSLTGHEAHAHSPQRSTRSRDDVWARIASKVDQPYRAYAFRSGPSADSRFGTLPAGHSINVHGLSGPNDPFIAPGPESSIGWRSVNRKTSTDESMPDYTSHGTEYSRAETEMSITWPRRDFQKHMDEATVEELIEALSPTKKGQLLYALSPTKSSSSGVQAPVNTPAAADLNLRSSVAEGTPNEGLANAASGHRGIAPAAAPTRWILDEQVNAIDSHKHGTVSTKVASTKVPHMADGVLTARRGRSSSGSSKRKRSCSADAGVRRDVKLNITPPAMIQKLAGNHAIIDEASSDADSPGSTDGVSDEKRKASNHGVSLNV
ncbi:uncharacterized protein HMPREF1541_00323 [Cyphellophora europaea CBS 101466]|uniref:Uncharacterized protein n=1 Tax=Cyphellophora europaea (strain CBS 101466) TaxID=1220924 RepID=W2SE02_CYPE1|nr:uncharacterized protein HMPREF1541_00323 [Cyphellophora europaea CBS 101466]ETN46139.1 hypothetical protein HMPREF1541_00323 [Cyphellophora europaea CBS 101466]